MKNNSRENFEREKIFLGRNGKYAQEQKKFVLKADCFMLREKIKLFSLFYDFKSLSSFLLFH
jgi:hypothetical protein